jgi:diguanylate cyclase (GGDEF)-like protein
MGESAVLQIGEPWGQARPDLARLALALSGALRLEEMFDRLPEAFRTVGPEYGWAVLARIAPSRYRGIATPGIGIPALRRLTDDRCGAGAWLSVGSVDQESCFENDPLWHALPSEDPTGCEPEVVVGVWTNGSDRAPGRSSLEQITRLVQSALNCSRVVENLLDQITRDPLTGLLNRRGLIEELERRTTAARRGGKPLSLLFIDLDRFKEINDRHGHQTGDEILARTARILASAVRSSDSVGRIGGDEFVIVFADTDLKTALGIARRLTMRIAAMPVATSQGPIQVRATAGVSSLDESDSSEALLRQADLRMLESKQARRTGPRSDASCAAPANRQRLHQIGR